MRNSATEGLRGVRGALTAVVLAVAGLALAWLCVRTTMVGFLASDDANLLRMAPTAPGPLLDRTTDAMMRQRGHLNAATVAAVRRAAAAAPLDAGSFLILGNQQLLDDEPRRAVATLEAGQRLDPRNRMIHLLLLDRYLRTGRYTDAGAQFSVLARLMGELQGPVATAMAQMSLAPETRDAVRRTLMADPDLERAVLRTLAATGVAPAALFALATPTALADAGSPESWGPILVARLVQQNSFAEAHRTWARIYRLPAAQADATIFDAGFAESPASPPFNWSLVASGLGAADIRNGALAIDYYGRDSGDLASQLLVLPPERYRFAFTVDPGQSDVASRLIWTLSCARGDNAVLTNAPVTAASSPRRVATDLVVPANCPAQWLTLRAEAGEFPAPIAVTVRDLAMNQVGTAAR